jgi:hypothetical protein
MTLGLVGTDGLFARAAVANEANAERAVKDGLDLLSAPPFKEILRIKDVKIGARAAMVSYGAQKGGDPKKAEVTWGAENGELSAWVQAPGSKSASARKLGDDPALAAALKSLDANVTFAAVVQPLKLDPAKSLLPPAPLVLAWGREGGDLWAHAGASDALVREILRARMGF